MGLLLDLMILQDKLEKKFKLFIAFGLDTSLLRAAKYSQGHKSFWLEKSNNGKIGKLFLLLLLLLLANKVPN